MEDHKPGMIELQRDLREQARHVGLFVRKASRATALVQGLIDSHCHKAVVEYHHAWRDHTACEKLQVGTQTCYFSPSSI